MLTLATIFLALSVVFSLLRLITAKTDADRVIAVDVLTYQLLALSLLLTFHNDNAMPLQFAFVLSLLGFLSTLVLSRLIPRP